MVYPQEYTCPRCDSGFIEELLEQRRCVFYYNIGVFLIVILLLCTKKKVKLCVYCLVLTMAPCRPSPVDPRTSSHLRYFFLMQLPPSQTRNKCHNFPWPFCSVKSRCPLMVTLLFFKSFIALLFIFVAVLNLVTVLTCRKGKNLQALFILHFLCCNFIPQ